MSRNLLYLFIVILVIFLLVVLLGRRNTNLQGTFVSPTPVQSNIPSEVSPSESMSPSTPVSMSPSVSVPTVQVTISPTSTP